METKKQKAIRKAYGSMYECLAQFIDNNGWLKWSDECPINPVISNYDYNSKLGAHRPKSLNGIETNNGWIVVESEEDLPKDSYNYWIRQSDGVITSIRQYESNKIYWNITATHYQPMIIPLEPLF